MKTQEPTLENPEPQLSDLESSTKNDGCQCLPNENLAQVGQKQVGKRNPLSVDGRLFHNLKYFKSEYQNTIKIKSRTLAQRVANLKASRNLWQTDTLELNAAEFAALISRADTRLPFVDFKKTLSNYISVHDLQLVRGGDLNDPSSLEPITIEDAYASYENNRSPFYFCCRSCIKNGETAKPFLKPLDHLDRQGCPVCGDKGAVDKRRLHPDEVRKRIAEHPAGIDLRDSNSTYSSTMSPLTVVCRQCGHKFTREAQDFFEYGSFVACSACVPGPIGESLAVGVVNFLLDTGHDGACTRELTPAHLQDWPGKRSLRHDAYFELPDLSLKIAIEHMGDQHTNPDNKFHLISRVGKQESFQQMLARDKWKQAACERASICWVDIPDLFVNCPTLLDAAKLVASHLIAKTDSKVEQIPGFHDRVEQLENESLVRKLITASGRLPQEESLQKQLDEEKSSVYISAYNPMTRIFTLACSKHKDYGTWTASAGNAIGSNVGDRKGTRCPKCGANKRGAEKRLSEQALDAEAKKYGFKKTFDFAVYESNAQLLPWVCLNNPEHTIKDSLAHLSRGCRFCRRETATLQHQQREHAKLNAKVKSNGDILLTPPSEYHNNSTKVRVICARSGGCGKEYQITPQKIMDGQLCKCDKDARSAKKRAAAQAFQPPK